MLKPVILFTTVLSTIGTLQLFDEVNNITASGGNGGTPADSTLTLSLYIYNLVFKFMPYLRLCRDRVVADRDHGRHPVLDSVPGRKGALDMKTPSPLISSVLAQAALWLAAFISVFPFYWMIVGATNTANEITGGKATLRHCICSTTSANSSPWSTCRASSGNSFFVAIVGTVLTLIVTSLAGYGFEMFRSRTRDRIFGGLLLLLSVPFAAMMIPLFVMFSQGGADQHLYRDHAARASRRSS